MPKTKNKIITKNKNKDEELPFETKELRRKLDEFLKTKYKFEEFENEIPIGNIKWGVYAFYDYDGEPIYVGQTNEMIRTRIRRHLTNQRTDAVAMSVLDPFEVYKIEVWPLPQFQKNSTANKKSYAYQYLNALEYEVFCKAIEHSRFKAILNEKNPNAPNISIETPKSFSAIVVSEEVYNLRANADIRNARRALIISKLAQVISERKVQGGLRRTLLTQAKRLQWLAERRYQDLGGDASVVQEGTESDASDED